MPVDIKENLIGGLNLDDSYYELPKNSYADAFNVTKDAVEQSQDLAITNIIGNRKIPYNKPTGINITIGAKDDIVRNRVYEFMWNSNSKHSIIIYDRTLDVRYKLIENLTDTDGVEVLEFSRYKKIVHIDIIYREEDEGDLLSWTDGNVTPRELNVKDILDGKYTTIKVNYIEAAKRPPLYPPTCVYGNDSTRLANALAKKLFMFTYRFGYDSFYKSTVSTYSKIALPIGYYGSDNDIDPSKNNFITITVETGDENVATIEIFMRVNVNNNWDDFVLVISLNKAELNIASNTTYDYLFYNDQLYPPVDQPIDIEPLADWLPQKANAQCLPNGNVKAYGGITENFDNYPVNELDVTITAANVTNTPPDADPPSITYTLTNSTTIVFSVNGNVPVGTRYQVYINFQGNPGIGQTYGPRLVGDYTSILGDTNNSVASTLASQFNAYSSVPSIAVSYPALGLNSWQASGFVPTVTVTQIIVTPGTPVGGTISTEKTWLPDANYAFGQVYENVQGQPMPGVTLKVNPVSSDNDYLVTTPSFSQSGGAWQTSVITAEVNHLPMDDATVFNWVRRRFTYGTFLYYETCDYQSDTDYLYFCLANIEKYKENNSQFIYGTVPITNESRIKIVAGITSDSFNSNLYGQDYEILGEVQRQLTGGGTKVNFIKVKKPSGSISPAYTQNMLVFVYTPMNNPTSIADSEYDEWGETYAIYTGWTIDYTGRVGTFTVGETLTGGTSGATAIFVGDNGGNQIGISDLDGTFVNGETITGGTSGATLIFNAIHGSVNYHRGMTQDQTSFQPAIYVWEEGDVYFHQRTMYSDIISTPLSSTVSVMDSSFSDFFQSAVNDNGRGQLVAPNAARTYFPATLRFGLAFQENTNINQLNRFLYNNLQDYDRSYGDIYKLYIFNRYMDVGQRFKIGSVPIFNQISKDSVGNILLASTDKLLNPINYYAGNYGVSVEAPVWVVFNNSRYFFDVNRGIWCRLSQDGITPISVLYKINSWATEHGVLRTGNGQIVGAFDSKANNCIFAFTQTNDDSAHTLTFDEEGNSFESFLAYHPEMMVTLGTLLITYKNGDCWTHDSDKYNNFYDVQYPSSIAPIFNDKVSIKKTYNAVAFQANETWESPEKGDVETSSINPQTLQKQQSKIMSEDYDTENNPNRYAALNNDMNSMTNEKLALWEGDYLKGNWVKINFVCPATKANKLVYFNKPYLNWQIDQRNF